MPKPIVPSHPVALSLAGGGSKGDWIIGNLEWLRTVGGLDIRAGAGTSTGSLCIAKIAALIATGDEKHWVELKDIYTKVKTAGIIRHTSGLARLALDTGLSGEGDAATIGLAHAVISGGNAVYSTSPLAALIEEYVSDSDWKAILKAYKTKKFLMGFCYTDYETGEALLATNDGSYSRDDLKAALLASASQPVLMPPVRVGDRKACYDGGIRDINPIRHLLARPELQDDSWVQSVLAIYTDAEAVSVQEAPRDVISILGRTIDLLGYNTVEGDLKQSQLSSVVRRLVMELNPEALSTVLSDLPPDTAALVDEVLAAPYLPVYSVSPPNALPGSSLVFDPEVAKKRMKSGFKHAAKYWAKPKAPRV